MHCSCVICELYDYGFPGSSPGVRNERNKIDKSIPNIIHSTNTRTHKTQTGSCGWTLKCYLKVCAKEKEKKNEKEGEGRGRKKDIREKRERKGKKNSQAEESPSVDLSNQILHTRYICFSNLYSIKQFLPVFHKITLVRYMRGENNVQEE